MKSIANMNEAELSAYVQAHLKKAGVDVVLSGGSAVTIYSENKYISKDLDLVNVYAASRRKIKTVEREVATGTLRIISLTDCVKDRLTAYYHWNDKQCLIQAKYVTQTQDVDLEEVQAWSEREGMLAKFEAIKKELE